MLTGWIMGTYYSAFIMIKPPSTQESGNCEKTLPSQCNRARALIADIGSPSSAAAAGLHSGGVRLRRCDERVCESDGWRVRGEGSFGKMELKRSKKDVGDDVGGGAACDDE